MGERRPEGRNAKNPKEAVELYKKYFDMYNMSIPSPIRTKLKEMVILYTTAINAEGKQEPRLIKGRMVSMVLNKEWDFERVVSWIDRNANQATKKGKMFGVDGAKFKSNYEKFEESYNANIPEKYKKELDTIVKETEGKNSVMWWNIAIGMTTDDYQIMKFPTAQDTKNDYIEAETGKRPKVVRKEEQPQRDIVKKVKEAKVLAKKEAEEQLMKWAAGQPSKEVVRKVTKAQAAKPVAKARKK